MALIELRNVTYRYPLTKEPALKNISADFEKGKFYGIIGENAGGKTTLCNLLRGLIPYFYKGKLEGDVKIFGKDIKSIDVDVLSTQIGYIFQNPFTQISGIRKTVFEEIAMGMENIGTPKDEIIDRVLEITKLLKIEHLIQNDPNALSGGQRQKVAFASIIAMDSDVYVIDEPTSQLDPDGTAGIFEIIHMLKEQGKTIILVEHKVDFIAEYADEILVLHNGELIVKDETHKVLSDCSLMERGAMIPRTVLLAHEMQSRGYNIDNSVVTKDECCKMINNIINNK